MNKKHSHMSWSWTLMVAFLTLGILDFRFGILGLICMTAPLYHVFKGNGKAHCIYYCPRASLLSKALSAISMNKPMPKFMMTKHFKTGLLLAMMTMFTTAMIHAAPDFSKMAFALFRLMTLSLLVGVLMGIFFKPRSWCTVCPMGYGAGLLDKELKKKSWRINFPVFIRRVATKKV